MEKVRQSRRETDTPQKQRAMERETESDRDRDTPEIHRAKPETQGSLSESLTAPSLPQLFELYSAFLKYFPGSHRQIYKNLQQVNAFIGRSVEKHRETLDPSDPRDLIDSYLLRMDKVEFGRGRGRVEKKMLGEKKGGEGGEEGGRETQTMGRGDWEANREGDEMGKLVGR